MDTPETDILPIAAPSSPLREEAHALLDRIDERGLSAVHALLSAYVQPEADATDAVVGYEIGSGQPITQADVLARARQAEQELEEGKTVSLDDALRAYGEVA